MKNTKNNKNIIILLLFLLLVFPLKGTCSLNKKTLKENPKHVIFTHYQYETNFEMESVKIFGAVPFPLMDFPRANQTYPYQLRSYNMINFLELVSDQYVRLFLKHCFNEFIMNRIPFFKKLKWIGKVFFKGLYGNVTNLNNPDYTTSTLQFTTDENGITSTYSLQDKPYMKVSVGLGNVVKFFRIDSVKRLTYLKNPNAPEYGVRAPFKFDF